MLKALACLILWYLFFVFMRHFLSRCALSGERIQPICPGCGGLSVQQKQIETSPAEPADKKNYRDGCDSKPQAEHHQIQLERLQGLTVQEEQLRQIPEAQSGAGPS